MISVHAKTMRTWCSAVTGFSHVSDTYGKRYGRDGRRWRYRDFYREFVRQRKLAANLWVTNRLDVTGLASDSSSQTHVRTQYRPSMRMSDRPTYIAHTLTQEWQK
jgi:hypothetical protein